MADGSKMTLLLQNDGLTCSLEVLNSIWMPSRSPALHGPKPVVKSEDANGADAINTHFFKPVEKEGCSAEDFDACFNPPGKKRRLTTSQVQFLERNFEVENKLEPERKVQLAKELGLQPRQVAIWFQNRRARYKNKQLEKDYDLLKANYDKLKADYDNLLKEKVNLKNEVLSLEDKLLNRETGKGNLEPSDPMNSLNSEREKPVANVVSENVSNGTMSSSAKSDVFDSESPHHTDGNHSSVLEPADSSYVLEPDQSDFSQDEEDNLSRGLLQHPSCFPKLEDGCYQDPHANPCNFEFPMEDQPLWTWNY